MASQCCKNKFIITLEVSVITTVGTLHKDQYGYVLSAVF